MEEPSGALLFSKTPKSIRNFAADLLVTVYKQQEMYYN